MCGLLRIFGQLWAEPWYGNNSSVLQGLTTGPHRVDREHSSVHTTADSGTA
jgi:hypothetical protein